MFRCIRFYTPWRNDARWWGEPYDGWGYDQSDGGKGLRHETGCERFDTPIGCDMNHYTHPRRYDGIECGNTHRCYHGQDFVYPGCDRRIESSHSCGKECRDAGHQFDFPREDSTLEGSKKVWGPVWYGDTSVYGAQVGKDFRKQPFPVYTDYMTEGKSASSARTLGMPTGYMEGFKKDFGAYFSKADLAGEQDRILTLLYILLYTCPHTTIYVSSASPRYQNILETL